MIEGGAKGEACDFVCERDVARSGSPPAQSTYHEGRREYLELDYACYTNTGLRYDCDDDYGELHYACCTNAPVEMVAKLIQKGVDVDAVDSVSSMRL